MAGDRLANDRITLRSRVPHSVPHSVPHFAPHFVPHFVSHPRIATFAYTSPMLRVFLAAPPRAERAEQWVRYGADGRPVARGHDVPARWPVDGTIDVVLAAGHVRLIALALPPMPRDRLRAAARFALEDQLATTAEESSISIGEVQNGRVLVAVTSDALVRAITHDRRVSRVIPESALAPHGDGWTWCASEAGDGFVRRADGSAFAVGVCGDALPPELIAALAQTARAGAPPAGVHVAFRCDALQLARWSQSAGVAFIAAPAWEWEGASPATFAVAPDFLDTSQRSDRASTRSTYARAFRPALLLAALALAVHVGALASQWTWLGVENWRLWRALVAEAAAAKLPDAATPGDAAAAIARQNAQLRHRAAQSAPADALPLLARAAPTLGALLPGVLRSAHYADNAWTIELGKLDAAALSRTTRRLAEAGVDALAAPTTAGMRMRLSLAATAR
jgi:general secretion pathway protein L